MGLLRFIQDNKRKCESEIYNVFCTKCGHELKSDSEFCSYCGAKVN